MPEALIRAQGLRYRYRGGPAVLDGLTFSLEAGERLGVVGANGAGKSTLLQLLAGVMEPEEGVLSVAGIPSSGTTLARIRERTGLVFQNPEDMLFMPTVREDVAFGPSSRRLPPEVIEDRVRRALVATGADALAGRPPWALSGGERRSASIAAVLALEPSILLMDEPSSGLDPWSRSALIRVVQALAGTVVIATHDLDLVLDTCERVILLAGGGIAADGPAGQVLANRSLLESNRLELPLRLQGCPTCGARPGGGAA